VRVYVESYGCAQNQGEGAAIARDLAAHGYAIAPAPEAADVSILVTCGVIGSTEARMVRRWEQLTQRSPRLVVTGCLVPLRTELFRGPARERTEFVPIHEQAHLPGLLGGGVPSPGAGSPRVVPPSTPSLVEEVIIAQGCTSGCAYCFSRLARGRLASVPAEEVARRVRAARDRGAREIRLTSLDTAAWGEDLPGQPSLADLVRTVSGVEGEFRLRVGMMSPQSLRRCLSDYLQALDEPRVYRFLHLPLQSGSDRVLEAMHRGYGVEEFRAQLAAARARFPDLHVATDLLVGFPGEDDADHRATEALVEQEAFETVNVTRFSARPGTVAARLPPVDARTAKCRSRSLTALRMRVARQRLERWIGRSVGARVFEHGASGSSVARLPNYLPVVLRDRHPLGADLTLRIDGARSTYLLGRALTAAAFPERV
jgi:threonylcarbamoyladenosine tRNA methylthiotransferase CDKAL1